MFPLLNVPLKKVLITSTLGHLSQFFFSCGGGHICARCRCCCPLLCLLELCSRGGAGTAQALLQYMGIGRLYPLVVILFRFDDLKPELLVKVNGRLVADLHMTVRQGEIKYTLKKIRYI